MESAYLNMHKSYYPFVSLMPGRSFATDKYRFGYQGQEREDDVTSVTVAQDSFFIKIF